MITAKFGDNWKDHAKKHYDIDAIIEIAWEQGRRAIALESRIAELERRNAELVEVLRKIENFASQYVGNEAAIKIRRMSSAAIRAGKDV